MTHVNRNCIAVASAKSYGDFVIAHSILSTVTGTDVSRIRLIACPHVRDLEAVLPRRVPVTWVDTAESNVPALFDVKKRGAWAAARSALRLRREFKKARRDREILAFDAIGLRERFIAGGWPAVMVGNKAANIYHAYSRFLSEHHVEVRAAAASPAPAGARRAGIFPESRLARKQLSAEVVARILDGIAAAGIDASVFIMDGDSTSSRESPSVVAIPRSFASLGAALRSVDLVISADSLPAHLGEYYSRRVFVASLYPNEFWLPPACFAAGRWGLVHERAAFSRSLNEFLLA